MSAYVQLPLQHTYDLQDVRPSGIWSRQLADRVVAVLFYVIVNLFERPELSLQPAVLLDPTIFRVLLLLVLIAPDYVIF